MTTQRLTVFVSRELEGLLVGNSTGVVDILRAHQVDFEVEFGHGGTAPGAGAERDLVLTLLASAAVVATVTPLVRTVLDRLTNRPVVATELRLVPVESSSGEVVRAADGTPVLHWVEVRRLLDDGGRDRSRTERLNLTLEGPLGVRFELGTSARDGRDEADTVAESSDQPTDPGGQSAEAPDQSAEGAHQVAGEVRRLSEETGG
ncbi:hypothetical protein O7626_18965 [Micromonospora sp. WMMD1102]|uniref:hypothetical protein n=1 Tax=Micromonospora sp. WMMD1102 TaxID=3016105 RepID=UPI0024158837|nr:hypothetical protein [Micromonospora sp. WMMD1102]MDG4787995.1 hypothetical protein [Micromonospora sp. WMMD1102]